MSTLLFKAILRGPPYQLLNIVRWKALYCKLTHNSRLTRKVGKKSGAPVVLDHRVVLPSVV